LPSREFRRCEAKACVQFTPRPHHSPRGCGTANSNSTGRCHQACGPTSSQACRAPCRRARRWWRCRPRAALRLGRGLRGPRPSQIASTICRTEYAEPVPMLNASRSLTVRRIINCREVGAGEVDDGQHLRPLKNCYPSFETKFLTHLSAF